MEIHQLMSIIPKIAIDNFLLKPEVGEGEITSGTALDPALAILHIAGGLKLCCLSCSTATALNSFFCIPTVLPTSNVAVQELMASEARRNLTLGKYE